MGQRKALPPAVESHVLLASARRCALCYGLNGDLDFKKGQIAHIDRDARNVEEVDLVYLCLEHHDEYDSRTSQAKGITPAELSEYKRRLMMAIVAGEHTRSDRQKTVAEVRGEAIRGHDSRVFKESDSIMSEGRLVQFLDRLQSDDSCFDSVTRPIDGFRSFFSETGNQFVDDELSKRLAALLAAIDQLLIFVAQHFFVFPETQATFEDVRLCMHPELNVDRGGPGTPDTMAKYDEYQKELDRLAGACRTAYRAYRLAVKNTLLLWNEA